MKTVIALLAEAEAALVGTSPAPWRVDHHLPGERYAALTVQGHDETPLLKMWDESTQDQIDARFIAASRDLVPRFVTALRETARLLIRPEWALRVIDESLAPRDLERIAKLEAVVDAARKFTHADVLRQRELRLVYERDIADAIASLDAMETS